MAVTPSIDALDANLRDATRAVATRLRERGRQAWLVGGAVRDLALGRRPKDIDLATDATPDEIEALFRRTIGVGKAFGTVIVVEGEFETQVTTFRTESGHHDGRRPSEVTFGRDLHEDAARRDFTCNAMYLDPLEDRLVDPFGGFADLEAKLLRTVGDARERFAEDGLRLVRMARIAAANELEVEAHTLAAARASASALRGVSAERRLAELTLIFERAGRAKAFRWLDDSQILDVLCPGFERLDRPERGRGERWRAIDALGDKPGAPAGFGVLFDPTCGLSSESSAPHEQGKALLQALKPSKALSEAVCAAWRACESFHAFAYRETNSSRIRLARDEAWPLAEQVLRAWRVADGRSSDSLLAFARWRESRTEAELRPAPWISSSDLAASGARPGPLWKALLTEAETLQLDGALTSRTAALDWLGRRLREQAPSDGSA